MAKSTNKYGYQQAANLPKGQQGQQDATRPDNKRKSRRLKLKQSTTLGIKRRK